MLDPASTSSQPVFYRADTPLTTSDIADMRASCANNLKQMGLVLKMFDHEHDGYAPAGWLSVYPEYCTDPRILTSTKDAPGTDSYLYLFPATNVYDMLSDAAEDPVARIEDAYDMALQ